MDRLTLGGFQLRLAPAVLPVVASYDPSGRSYLRWIAATLAAVEPPPAVAGLVPPGAWAFCALATWRSLGAFGVLLAAALCVALVWPIVSWGRIRLNDGGVLGWLADAVRERRVTGRMIVNEGERH
jgi:hypothetical protein